MTDAANVLDTKNRFDCLKLMKVNLSMDTFSILKEDAVSHNPFASECSTFSGYLADFIVRGNVFRDDIADFRSYSSLDFLREFFTKTRGQELHCLSYRRKMDEEFRWALVEIYPAEDFALDRMAVYIAVKDVNASISEQSFNISGVLRALCGSYDSIYCLDLEQNKIIPYRAVSHDVATFDAFLRTNPSYQDLMGRYIAMSVLPEDRGHVSRITDLKFIRDYLMLSRSYHSEYRTVYNGEICWYRIHYSRIDVDGELRYVAIGLVDVSDEKRIDADFFRNAKYLLVVSPNGENRDSLCSILREEQPVLTAGSAAEAMELLKRQYESIAAIVTEQNLPDITGCQLLCRLKSDERYKVIPVILTEDGCEHVEEGIRSGAADFFSRPYQPALIRNRVRFLTRYQECANMRHLLEKDPTTGLFSKEYFLRSVEQMLKENPGRQYAVLVSDVEHFHFYKERNGIETAKKLLGSIAKIGADQLNGLLIGGRLSEDVFAFFLRYTPFVEEDVHSMQESIAATAAQLADTVVSVKFGMYVLDEDISITSMCDRAVLAVKSIKGMYGVDLAEYDLNLRQDMMRTQQIVENAVGGLDKEQFVVYYQPKHDIHRGVVGGAEAVIRWVHPTMGFMNPVSFIPLFEKNGFIEVLDEFVLNRVCKDILERKENGEPVVPVSVNISRVDFSRPNLADRIIGIVDSYGLEHSLIHVEITETGYAEDPAGITRELLKLHEAGFVIELDDFGTGFSSLSALSALPVDVLKLDMSLLRHDDMVTNRKILEFSMQLAKIMKLETIQEGVETKEELERVSSLGCDHVQGYYFSKPLPKDKFNIYCKDQVTICE